MNKFIDKKRINFLTIFLLIDLLAIFSIFKTSNATYTSKSLGKAEMDVALYAFRYAGVDELKGVDGGTVAENIDISLGDINPGETKYYKFNIYNYLMEDEVEKISETSISYNLKIITTTNLPLEYSLYLNQSPFSNSSSNLLDYSSSSDTDDIITDGFGTYYKVFPVSEKCFKLDTNELKYDEYTLVVHFPGQYSNVLYQDLIESIKVQIESKQVLPDDPISESIVCR